MSGFYGHAGDVRAFLAHTRLLDGCEWASDVGERLESGRTLIEELACGLPEEGYNSRRPELWDAAECAAVLEFLGTLAFDHCHCKSDDAGCGYSNVLSHVRDSMLAQCGELNEPPHGPDPAWS